MLNITITQINSTKGQLLVAVFNSKKSFLDPSKAIRAQAFPIPEAGNLTLSFADLPPGEYAVSVVHDLNNNGKLDTNLFGVPTEPYGFSQNARPKFRAARWDEAKIYLSEKGGHVAIQLDTW